MAISVIASVLMNFTFLQTLLVDCFIFVNYYLGDARFCPENDDESVARTLSCAQAVTGLWGELHVYL
jgi:hypothetical protein